QGPGHGTGYQDQIIIEARDFLRAIETRAPVWPTFEDGMEVNQVIEASMVSSRSKAWVEVSSV
ncbi:MAG: gfo/Idh/MocA family oxidoreductase, partial [Marivivens sp.]|nr:gfo/Idh/MocA family oxidoreductase [Marivivens sp.]NBT53114.1 gfo/Idh/MocA family oxidoreductase [Marivivens sp.]NDH04182.1 gfo/Idh/MocA family oxidoreductase [Marivivens sp.]